MYRIQGFLRFFARILPTRAQSSERVLRSEFWAEGYVICSGVQARSMTSDIRKPCDKCVKQASSIKELLTNGFRCLNPSILNAYPVNLMGSHAETAHKPSNKSTLGTLLRSRQLRWGPAARRTNENLLVDIRKSASGNSFNSKFTAARYSICMILSDSPP